MIIVNCLWGFTIFVNAWFGQDTGVRPGAVLTCLCFVGNSNTSLLLFPKCHISLSILMGCFNTFKRS